MKTLIVILTFICLSFASDITYINGNWELTDKVMDKGFVEFKYLVVKNYVVVQLLCDSLLETTDSYFSFNEGQAQEITKSTFQWVGWQGVNGNYFHKLPR